MANKVSIVIVGAGAAGLAAGTRLLKNGITNILLLEAENRLGGRIFTEEFGDNVVDLGAQWCHGEKDNVVFEMANPLGLLESSKFNFSSKEGMSDFVDAAGTILSKKKVSKVFQVLSEIVYGDEMNSFNCSVGEYASLIFEEKLKTDLIGLDRKFCYLIYDWYHKLENSVDATDSWYETPTTSSFSEYLECEGDLLITWKSRGFKTVLDLLLNKYPDPSKALPLENKIYFNKEVTNIIWSNQNNGTVSVHCADGSVYVADHVIVTVSLGVLKEGIETLFTPELPLMKQKAIRGLNFGTVNKLIFEYPYRWWPENHVGFSFVWTDEQVRNLHQMFDGSQEENLWLTDIFGFYSVDYQPNVLEGWIVRESGRTMETLPEREVKQKLILLIEKFLGKQFNIPKPINFIRSSWFTNKHFRGSYSYRSTVTEKLNTSAADLAVPLKNNLNRECVYFAGEATHDYYYSTVHGAIETGWREADRIINNCLKRRKTGLGAGIVIIGAGISGLAAAKTLLDKNYQDFIVLESQSKPGGRIQTHYLNDSNFVEIGAQWIHGNNNELWKLAKKYDLLSNETSEEGMGVFIRDDGYVINRDLVNVVDFVVGQILEKCEEFFYLKNGSYPESVGDYLETEFEQYLNNCIEDSDELKQLKREIFNWHVRFQIIDNACLLLNKLSAKQWGSYVCSVDNSGQEHINLKNGYTSIIKVLCDLLPKNCIQLKSTVSSIKWDNSNNLVVIECTNGYLYEANYAICTVSLGVLKKFHKKLFHPELPLKMQETIEKMGFWVINKIFLLFDIKWWNVPGFQIVWTDNDLDNNSWIKWISGFDEVRPDGNILVGWIGGAGAKIVEHISEENIGKGCVDLLRKITGDNSIPYPSKVIRSKWLSDSNFCGAYSHTTSNCDSDEELGAHQLMKVVRNKQNIPVLALAGEACHMTQFSTTHGAYESGQKQACIALDNLILSKII